MKVFTIVCIAAVVVGVANAAISSSNGQDNLVQPQNDNHVEENLMKKLNSKCAERDMTSCVMLKLVTYMNRMLKKSSIAITNDLEITQTQTTLNIEEGGRSLPDGLEAMSEDAQLTQIVAGKIWNFIKSRQLRFKLLDDADIVVAANPANTDETMNIGVSVKTDSEARGKKNNMGPIIAAAVMKLGLIKALAFKALVLLVGKALLVSKVALLLASIIGLKKLFSGHEKKHVTYEVVSHPHHVHEPAHEVHGGGWGRGFSSDAQEMAYGAQKPSVVA